MIPPHLFFQLYFPFRQQNGCTSPKCRELSEHTDSAHTKVEDLSSRMYEMGQMCMIDAGHDTRLLHPSCTACRRTANLPGLA